MSAEVSQRTNVKVTSAKQRDSRLQTSLEQRDWMKLNAYWYIYQRQFIDLVQSKEDKTDLRG